MRAKSSSNTFYWLLLLVLSVFLFLASSFHPNDESSPKTLNIGIVIVLTNDTNPQDYEVAINLSAYTGCIRGILGSRTDFGNIRIMKKGTGWSRDDWLTSGLWNPARDFMLHGWKTKQLKTTPSDVLEPIPMNYDQWYNPLARPIVVERCFIGNTSWSYSPRVLGDRKQIDELLMEYARKVDKEKAKSLGRLPLILENP
ncbi:hypothetical protein L3Y34_004099 [Caenorhabditis briggsae]|uniref:Uncharacterized protein n=1 Tax=Caenorhabditis briggsae TaxID=6238 RepID=A0AAE9AD11_CAEBR|nr:hypothetical protein L3Y34_004099 [Caenorhabditis briggsae]